MLPKYEVKPPPPLFPTRALVRLIAFGACLFFLVYLLHRATTSRAPRVKAPAGAPAAASAKPQAAGQLSDAQMLDVQLNGGRAVGFLAAFTMPTPCPFSIDAAVAGVVHLEHVPLPEHLAPRVVDTRRAPIPDLQILAGAEDRKGFLIDEPIVTELNPENVNNQRRRRDADARYHLLQLANAARAADLAADARSDVRYTALVEKPAEYRGQLVHLGGDLIWVETHELKRQVPALEHAYVGLLVTDRPDHRYWILFTELPPDFPPRKEWRELYAHHVQFNGYFLKTLLVDDPKDKDKQHFIPVLVGKTVELPAAGVAEAWDFPIGTALGVVAGFLVFAGLVVFYLRGGDRSHAARLEALRDKIPHASESGPPAPGPLPEFRFDDTPGEAPPAFRNGEQTPR